MTALRRNHVVVSTILYRYFSIRAVKAVGDAPNYNKLPEYPLSSRAGPNINGNCSKLLRMPGVEVAEESLVSSPPRNLCVAGRILPASAWCYFVIKPPHSPGSKISHITLTTTARQLASRTGGDAALTLDTVSLFCFLTTSHFSLVVHSGLAPLKPECIADTRTVYTFRVVITRDTAARSRPRCLPCTYRPSSLPYNRKVSHHERRLKAVSRSPSERPGDNIAISSSMTCWKT
ncbi:hypothetical protein TNCV_566831 [Trichonephila clavipes]|nr:hypothetical protein TNCV_566831 [Trichonephila clavipes]